MKQYDVIALGELLIDFTDYGKSEQGNPVFEANPGGAHACACFTEKVWKIVWVYR